MSRRPPALAIVAVLSLVAAGLAGPLVSVATATVPYGSHVFQANPYVVPGAQSYPVYSGSTVAQSFLVNQTYYLQNTTLRVLNSGNKMNALNVSIHPDDPVTHLPVMSTTLGYYLEVTPTNATGPGDTTRPFYPAPLLEAGRTYWIVAQNNAPQAGNGYEWFSTNGTTYPDGQALLAAPNWAGLPVDMYFINFGQQYDANVTPAMTATPAQVQPGDFVTFRVDLNNTGSVVASRVWVNDTLPAALTNASLDFPEVQPLSAARFPNLTFANVTNGPHSFTLTAQVAIGTPPGALVQNAVTLAYTNGTGAVVQGGRAMSSVRVGLVTKQLYLAGTSSAAQLLTTTKPTSATPQTSTVSPGGSPVDFVLAPSLAKPLHARNVNATLWLKTQTSPPQSYRLTLGLLDNGSPIASLSPSFQITASGFQPHLFTFPLSNYTFGYGHQVGLRITNVGGPSGSTDSLVVAFNSTANDSRLEVVTDTYVAIGPLVLRNQQGPTTTWSTLDSLLVQANVSDPFGTSRIKGVWINITSPSGHLAAAGAMPLSLSDPSPLPAWNLYAYTLAPPLTVGLYRIVVHAMEDNGVSSLAEGWAEVIVPSFTFTMAASASHAETGGTLAVSLYYNNTGSGTAGRVWVNDTLPAGLSFAGSNVTVTSVNGSSYTWAFTDVPPGAHALRIDLLVTGTAVESVQNQATLDFTDLSGHPFATLRSNVSVFLNGPDIALSLASAPSSTIHANQSVSYTFVLTNTGAAAKQVWLNDTLPPGFVYASTNARSLGWSVSVVGSEVDFAYSGMPANSTWQFDLVATAAPALLRGAAYTDAVTLVYSSTNDLLLPASASNASLVAVSPGFPGASMRFLASQSLPGAVVPARISLDNLGNEAAPRVWVNLTLDTRLTLYNASAPYTAGSGTVSFVLDNVAVGTHAIFLNFTVSPVAASLAVLAVIGTLEARDGFGNRLSTVDLAEATVLIQAVQMSLVVTPGSPMFEVGVPYRLNIALLNQGLDTAANVWLNLTLPTSLVYLNDSAANPPSIGGPDYSWHWTDVMPGSFSFQLDLQARTTIANGVPVAINAHLDSQGSNLQSLPGWTGVVQGTIVAPDLVLTLTASADSLIAGGTGTLVYRLRMTNAGLATAQSVYLVDTIDTRLQVVTYDSAMSAVLTNQTYNWTFTGLAPGATRFVNLTVRVPGGVAGESLIPNVFEATYTNSAGVVLGRVRSAPITITVATDLTNLAIVGLAAAGVVLGAVAVLRRRKVEIEEVFLVYRDGVLISHLSRTLLREKDEDVLSGMLTAVQEFVREAFQYGEHRDLHQLDFGDYRILIERGEYVFLAVVYSGKESLAIHKKVRAVIRRVEHEFGSVLETWDGDMEEVIGARDLIRDTLLGSSNHNHAPKPATEAE